MRSYFDQQAATYDDYAVGDDWTPNSVLEQVLAVGSDTVETALDLGTGTGQTLEAIVGIYPEASLTGSDLSPAMLARAACRVPDARLIEGDLRTICGRLADIYDLVTAIGCLELLADPVSALPLLAARVKPGGRLALTFQPFLPGLEAREASDHGGAGVTHLTTGQILRALPGCELLVSRLFVAYRRAGVPISYELLLLRKPRAA